MWRQDDLIRATCATGHADPGAGPRRGRRVRRHRRARSRRPACRASRPVRSCTAPAGSPPTSTCPSGGSVVTLESTQLRRRRDARHDRARSGSVRLTIVGDAFAKPIAPGARRRARPVGPVVARADHPPSGVMWSEARQGGPARAQPRHAAGRRVLRRRRRSGSASRSRPPGPRRRPRKFALGDERQGHHRRRSRRRARLGRDGPRRRSGAPSRSATTRTREDGGHVRRDRRRPVLDPRRLRDGRGRRHASPCSAAARCASTPAARRSSPKRSRRCSRSTPRCRRRRGRGSRREVRRGDHRRRRAPARFRGSTSDVLVDHVKAKLAPYKAPKRVLRDRHDRPGPQRQGRLPPDEAVRRWTRSGSARALTASACGSRVLATCDDHARRSTVETRHRSAGTDHASVTVGAPGPRLDRLERDRHAVRAVVEEDGFPDPRIRRTRVLEREVAILDGLAGAATLAEQPLPVVYVRRHHAGESLGRRDLVGVGVDVLAVGLGVGLLFVRRPPGPSAEPALTPLPPRR